MVTGIRSLCAGLGPALFGLLFQIAQVPLDDEEHHKYRLLHPGVASPFPGAPFLVGTGFVLVAFFVAMNTPDRLGKKRTERGHTEPNTMELTELRGSLSTAPSSLGTWQSVCSIVCDSVCSVGGVCVCACERYRECGCLIVCDSV